VSVCVAQVHTNAHDCTLTLHVYTQLRCSKAADVVDFSSAVCCDWSYSVTVAAQQQASASKNTVLAITAETVLELLVVLYAVLLNFFRALRP
jgi:hypothetical protein